MRAAASNVCARALRRQSQRATRRSAPFETLFHPVPSHSGQTSTETFINPAFPVSTLHPRTDFVQVQILGPLCTSCGVASPLVEDRGKQEHLAGTSVANRRKHPISIVKMPGSQSSLRALGIKIITGSGEGCSPSYPVKVPTARGRWLCDLRPDRIFAVDNARTRGRIASIRISPQPWLHLPQGRWGRHEILSRRKDEQS